MFDGHESSDRQVRLAGGRRDLVAKCAVMRE